MSSKPDPLPHPIKGSELMAGMTTYIQVQEGDNTKFRPDVTLTEYLGPCPPSGIHFRTSARGTVCYWTGARVWVKDTGGPKR